ncbi:hypothetical protein GQ651_04100 [Alphaproteobacteria bacterium GH1-50]|uniref:Uncharacterized protein n=1 Tax=Kangsaoukella pontilimi TaxID=2691042 RepID=A0A7C9IET4_9RHOB|nr:hypothetical protein [Kangsaoukella pontilimi]MXQ07024.1 hypothetical protein [Kangsaoukella pontilimi]
MRIISSLAVAAALVAAPAVTSDFSILDGAAHAGNHSDKGNSGKGQEKRSSKASDAGGNAKSGAGAEKSAGKRSVNADLKGMNSLNRSLNGLMNSSDPKMDGIRDFVVASADYEAALDALDEAKDAYQPLANSFQADLNPLRLMLPSSVSGWDDLEATLASLASAPEPDKVDYMVEVEVEVPSEVEGEEPTIVTEMVLDQDAYDAAVETWTAMTGAAKTAEANLAPARDAWTAYAIAFGEAQSKEAAASEDAMIAAIVDGLNATGAGPVTEDDITDEMVAWVAARLGAGDDLDGLIDAYIASQ